MKSNQIQKPLGINDYPKKFKLYPAFPNPFNASTVFKFDLPQKSDVKFEIYNVLGNKVWESSLKIMEAGRYSQIWKGKNKYSVDVASGIYYVILKISNKVFSQKILLLK